MIIHDSEFSSLNSTISSYNGSEFLYLCPIQPVTFLKIGTTILNTQSLNNFTKNLPFNSFYKSKTCEIEPDFTTI